MKKVLLFVILLIILVSCNRSITPYKSANGKAGKCGSKGLR